MTEEPASESLDDKQMSLRYPGECRLCGAQLPARVVAVYERSTKTVRCVECSPLAPGNDPSVGQEPVAGVPDDAGAAGSSARREYERRKANDERRLRERWGKLGGIAVALSDEKQSTKAWATGAEGEERLGALLDSIASESIAMLHDRRIPGTRANIDHIAVTPGGVWVIDAKRYKGRPELKVEGGILRPRVEKVLVGRRDCTKLVDGLLKQTDVIRSIVGDVPVTGALCFVGAEWPLIGGAFTTRSAHVLWPKRLAKLLTATEGTVDVTATRETLTARLTPA